MLLKAAYDKNEPLDPESSLYAIAKLRSFTIKGRGAHEESIIRQYSHIGSQVHQLRTRYNRLLIAESGRDGWTSQTLTESQRATHEVGNVVKPSTRGSTCAICKWWRQIDPMSCP
jgi:hypothetical protein